MRKEDLTVPAIIAEAIEIIVGLIYIGLQIYYGLSNHVPPYKFICNIVGLLLVYAGLTILSNHPEQVNRLKTEVCVGKVRKYTLASSDQVCFCGWIDGALCGRCDRNRTEGCVQSCGDFCNRTDRSVI